jgi:uncharacterized membrane protein YccC
LIETERETPRDVENQEAAARAAVAAARRQYSTTRNRPAGPTRRDRAFVELLTLLERALSFATGPFRLQPRRTEACIKEGNQLAAAIVQTLEASAEVLTGGAPPDLRALDAARLAHRQALDRWAEQALRAGTATEDVLSELDADHGLRVISYVALAIGANSVISAGGEVGDGVPLPAGTPLEGRTRPLIRVARTVSAQLTPSSAVLHQSLRVGIGLGLAVLLARLLRLDHAFWVVLGTLSVLRSNAFGTGRTTLQALMGTVIGFAVGAVFTVLVGATSPVLWIALPVAVFLATYAAGAIGFMVGQAAFTVLVIILFNLISPIGWRVGLARIEDVAVGVGISIVTALLLWPRGARGELVSTLAGLYRATAAFLAPSFDRVLEAQTTQDVAAARRLAVRARDRAGEAFGQFLNERGSKPLDPESAAFLLAAGTNAIIVGDLLNVVADMGYQADGASNGASELLAQTQLMLAGFLRLADRLESTPSALLSGARVSDATLREVALSWLSRWRDGLAEARPAIATVIAGEWIKQLGELETDLEGPVSKAAEVSRIPWWR